MGNRDHVGEKEFKMINWLPVQERVDQCISTHILKFIKSNSPVYMSRVFAISEKTKINTRSQTGINLIQPYRSKQIGQKAMSYIGPKVWNCLPENIKSAANVNVFKHKIKEFYFEKVKKLEYDNYK